MAHHLILIPGFGMRGKDLGPVQDVAGVEKPVPLDPDWDGCCDLPSVATKLAEQINGLYVAAPPPRKFVVYGFSLGADLLMEMVNQNALKLGEDSFLILADPNLNKGTCFVSSLAAASATLQEFLDAITTHANGPGAFQHSRWLVYQSNVQQNTDSQNWPNLQRIAQSVLSSVDQRFAAFKVAVGAGGKTASGVQVKVLLSEESEEALAATSPSYRFFWIVCPSNMHHFELADGGNIKKYAEIAFEEIYPK